MKVERILYCIFGLFLFAACSGGEDYERQLERFEEMNRTDVPLCVDSVQPLVRHYDHWWHSPNHRMRAYYMLGCAYRDQGSAPRALENYQRAVSIADTTDARCDLNTLMRIHSQMAQLFLLQRLPEQEEEELRIAQRLAWQIGDTLSALTFENHICSVLYNKGNYKACINRTLRFHEKYSSWGFNNELKLFSVDCVKSYLALKDYVHAKKYLYYYESCPYFKTHPEKITGGIGALFVFKGQYHLGIQKIDSAEYYFKKALPYKHLGDNEMLTYEGLYKTYSLSQKVDSVLKYTSLYSDALTHSFNKAQSEATIQAKAMYDYSTERNLAEKKAREVSWLVQALITFLLIAILIAIYARYRNEKRKRKIGELEQRYDKACTELLCAEETIMALEREKATNDNRIAAYVTKADQLREEVVYYQKALSKIDKRRKDVNLVETKIVNRFRYSLTHISEQDKVQDSHWQELKEAVESLYPSFYQVLNERQELQENEYRVCLLVKAGFEPFDIDILMDKKHTYASNTRKRLHKKVFGIEGSGAEFDQKIRNI